MLKNVETERLFSLLDGIQQRAPMLGNVGIQRSVVARPRPSYSANSTPKKGRGSSTWMLTIPDIAPAPQGQTEQSERPKKDTGSSSWMMTIDDIRAVPLEQTKQQGHPKRGSVQSSALGQNVQPVHPKKETVDKQAAQSAHLKKPETDRTHCRQIRQFGHPKKGSVRRSALSPRWLRCRANRTKLTPEKARGLSLADRQTAQTAHAKKRRPSRAVHGAATW